MVELYPLVTFGNNPTAASIDTPLHGFLPFPHVDHLHPDWAIALAASANGKTTMEEFNAEFGHKLAWLPWQRPGFELGMMLRKVVAETPGCDGVILGGHGLFTWGDTQRSATSTPSPSSIRSASSSSATRARPNYKRFGGNKRLPRRDDRKQIAAKLMPHLRGAVSRQQRLIGTYTDSPQVLEFVNSAQAQQLAHLGTSCPDHFIRTKIRPMFVDWNPADDPSQLPELIDSALETYRAEYAEYYTKHALPDSPGSATPAPRSSSFLASACSASARTRPSRASQASSTSTLSASCRAPVLWATNETCTEIPQASAASRRTSSPSTKLRRASSQRGLPHRVLEARRGQDSPPAA